MPTKTFKIGEHSKGGIITAIATDTKVTIICKEWDMSSGHTKGSDQSNAREMHRLEVSTSDSNVEREVLDYLCEDTTSYYADQILTWIKSKTKLTSKNFW